MGMPIKERSQVKPVAAIAGHAFGAMVSLLPGGRRSR